MRRNSEDKQRKRTDRTENNMSTAFKHISPPANRKPYTREINKWAIDKVGVHYPVDAEPAGWWHEGPSRMIAGRVVAKDVRAAAR